MLTPTVALPTRATRTMPYATVATSTGQLAGHLRSLLPVLYGQARSITRDATTAEDVVQQAMVRLWQSRERLPEAPGQLRSYCFRMVINLSLDHLRNSRLRARREAGAGREAQWRRAGESDPALAVIAGEAWELAMQLPAPARDVLVLRFGMGLTLRETAAELALPEGTVSTRQRAGLEALRERLATEREPRTGVADVASGAVIAALATGHSLQPAVPATLARTVESIMATSAAGKMSGIVTTLVIVLLLLGVAAISSTMIDPGTTVPELRAAAPASPSDPGPSDPERDVEPIGGPDGPDDPVPANPGPVVNDSHGPASVAADASGNRPIDHFPGMPSAGLRGRLVDSYGQPLGGTLVRLYAGTQYPPIGQPVMHPFNIYFEGDPGDLMVETRTDATGRFAFSGLVVRVPDELMPRPSYAPDDFSRVVPYHISPEVGAGFLFFFSRSWTLAPDEVTDVGDQALTRYGSVTGHVVDANGLGVPRVRVAADFMDMPPMRFDNTAITGADGSFELNHVPPGEHTFTVANTGFQRTSATAEVHAGRRTSGVGIRAVRMAENLRFVVLDEDDEPISGAELRTGYGGSDEWVATDRNGEAWFPYHGAEAHYLRIRAAGYVEQTHTIEPGNGQTHYVYRLVSAGVVTGRIEQANGRPGRCSIEIVSRDRDDIEPMRVYPGEDGSFRAQVPPGRVSVVLTDGIGSNATTLQREIIVEAGQMYSLGGLPLPSPRTVAVEVVDPQGRPVAGARVFAGQRSFHQATTDSAGLATLEHAGRYQVSVRIEADGWPVALEQVDAGRETHVRVTIQLGAGQTLSGIVRDPSGASVAGAMVRLGVGEHGSNAWTTTTTNATGKYTFAHVPPGDWHLSVVHDGAAAARSIEVHAGGTPETDLQLEWLAAPDEAGIVAGRLVDADGTALRGTVQLSRMLPGENPARVDSVRERSLRDSADVNGLFRVGPGIPGEHTALIATIGGETYAFHIAVDPSGSQTYVLVCDDAARVGYTDPEGGAIAVTVRDTAGDLRPHASMTVWRVPLDGGPLGWREEKLASPQPVTINGLAPGRYRVRVNGHGTSATAFDVTVAAGATVRRELTLGSGRGAVSVRFEPELTRSGISSVRMTIWRPGEPAPMKVASYIRGEIVGLTPGETYRFRVMLPGHEVTEFRATARPTEEVLDDAPDAPERIVVRLQPAAGD